LKASDNSHSWDNSVSINFGHEALPSGNHRPLGIFARGTVAQIISWNFSINFGK
jgi:hypothetical protein